MTTYICKCGRKVMKSTNADNTGNRDTAGCTGCPYLLPWGPYQYIEGQGYTTDVQGYECRMSPTISYITTYRGRADDKCTLHILSLDLDFLDNVQAWIYDNAADTLSAGFSRGSMRGTDFSDKGRYSLSISCVQNKKGMAAKAALLEHFFGPDKHRLDMFPEKEKSHILAAIKAGKARAQEKEKNMIYKDPATGWLYRVGPEPFQGCYWVYYLDPTGSTIWKRCPQGSLYAGNETVEGEEEYLRLNAKRKGWKPVEETPVSNPTPAAHASPVGAGAATQSLSAAEPASLEVESAPAAFDYSALDLPTRDALHWAENEIRDARRDYIARLAQAVYIAHDALCSTGVRNSDSGKYESSDDTFISWCKSVGLSKTTAYQLLQVQSLLSGSTPEEQATLEAAGPSLLYAAAKPSAPAELVQAVKDGDITTHKQYQEALAEIRTRDAKIKELLEMSEESDRRADEARAWAKAAEKARDEACRELDGARQAFQAAKLRGDKLKEQLEASKDQVIEARVVDREEVERLAQERAAELTAPLRDELEELRTFRQNQDAGQVQRDAYDAFILAARIMDNTWQALRPQAARLAEGQRSGAKNLLLQKLMEIKEDVIHVC